ncbi:alpha-amylase [Rufibacter sp. DG15C]|nr:alpha-amylase [Rufibacter sp. DG15C]
MSKKINVVVQTAPVSYYTRYTQFGIPFSSVPDAKDVVMYEVNLRAFSTAGNLNGITARLDSIKAMGTNVIWLMPIYPIGKIKSVNSPYSIQNYKEVNPEFGNLESIRNLTTEAHKRGMAVVLDWVANHTSWDNPWINNKEWYTQVNGQIVSPVGTNWQDVADLNFDNQSMRGAMIDALKYWVFEANIDGYRFDAADYVPYDFWKQALDSLQAIPNRKLVLLAEGERNDHFTAGFQMNYGWSFYGKLKEVFAGQAATNLYSTHLAEYANIPAGKHKLRFTTNHDESAWDATPIVLFNGKNGALAASVIATYMGGVPLFYGSQEVGTPEKVPFFYNSSINWTLNPDMFKAYQSLMKFHGQSNALKEGALKDYSNLDVVCFTRTTGTEEVLVVVNVRNKPIDFTLPAAFKNSTWMNALSADNVALGTAVTLNNYAYLVLKK